MRDYDLDDDDDAIIRQLMKDRPIASMGNQRLGDKAPAPLVNDEAALFSVNGFASVAEATLASRPGTSSFSNSKHLNSNNKDNPEDVSTDEQISASALAAAARIAKEKAMEKRLKETFGLATKEENLGTNFFLTPWIKPTFEKAEAFRQSQIFRGGQTADGNISLVSSPDLGLGVRLYFQFLLSVCIGLAVMWFFALPLLAFSYNSSGMPPQGQEASGLYRFSLGNLGYESPAAYNNFMSSPRLCTIEPFVSNGETCVSVGGYEFSLGQIQLILASCEFLQVVVWLGVSVYLGRRMQQLRRPDQAENLVSVTHYAVYVDNLPPLITAEEVIAHFSQLYQLQHTDFRDRLPVEDSRPVQSVDHNGLQIHAGSWVAECTLYRRIGGLLRQFKAKEPLLKRLVRQRAEMKRFAQDTTHPLGPDALRFEKAELRMLATARDVDAFFAQMRQKQRVLATQFRMKRAATQYRHYLDTEKQQNKQLKTQQSKTPSVSKPKSSSTSSLFSWVQFNSIFNWSKATIQNKNKNNTPRISFQEPVEHSDIEKNLRDAQQNNDSVDSQENIDNVNLNDLESNVKSDVVSTANSRPSSAVAALFHLSPRSSAGNKSNNETVSSGNISRPSSSNHMTSRSSNSNVVEMKPTTSNNINNNNNNDNNKNNNNNNNNDDDDDDTNIKNNNNNNKNSTINNRSSSSSNNSTVNSNNGRPGSSHSVAAATPTTPDTVPAVSLSSISEQDTPDAADVSETPAVTPAVSRHKTLQDFLDVTSPVTIEDAEVVGAFVVFEYNESQARCLQDFSVFGTFPFSLAYPPQMLLHNRRLRVRKAPEPDQIIYENLEFSDWYKTFLQLRTACVATLLLLVCFSIVVFGASLRSAYSQRLPSQPLCAAAVPALYAPQFTLLPKTLQTLQLRRPSVTSNLNVTGVATQSADRERDRDTLDNQCVAILDSENAFFATYDTPSSSLGDTVSRYSFSACFSSSLLRLYHNVSRHNPHNLSDIFLQYHRDTFNDSVADDYYDTGRDTSDIFQWGIAKRLLLMRHNVSYFSARFNQNFDTEQVSRDIYSATNDFSCPRYSSSDIFVPFVNVSHNNDNNNNDTSVANRFVFNMSTVSFCPCVTLHTRQTCVLAPCQLGLVTVRDTYTTSINTTSISLNTTLSNTTSSASSSSSLFSPIHEVESEAQCAVAATSVAACYCATVSSKRPWFSSGDTQDTRSVAQLLFSAMFGGDTVRDTPASDRCADYETVLWSSRFVEYGLILVTVAVNRLLKMALVTLVSYEGHASVDEAQRSVLIKLFAATALNTGVVVLLAYGLRPPVTDTLLSKDDTAALFLSDKTNFSTEKWRLSRWLHKHAAGVSLGPYTDLTRDWFGNVGFYFLSTLTFTSLLPLLLPTLNWSILKPLQRRFVSWSLDGQKAFHLFAHGCCGVSQPVLQSDLDTLLLAQPFQFTAHAAQVLSIVTVSCCYATGLPLLPLLALLLTFFFLRLDTFLLLRVSVRPPALDHRVLHTLFSLLYLGVALRLVLGIWAFSNPDILDPEQFWVVETAASNSIGGDTQGGVDATATQSGTSQLSDTVSLHNYATQLRLLRDTLSVALQSSATLADSLSLETLRHIPDTVVAIIRYVLVSRCLQPVSFPLFLLLTCLCVAWVTQHLLWRYLLYPFRFLWRRLRFLFNFVNLKKKKMDTFSAAREKGYVHPFELLLSSSVGDEVEAVASEHRCEAAPFTGIYYQFVQRKTLETNTAKTENSKNAENSAKKGCFYCVSRLLCPKCCCRKRNKKTNKYALDVTDTHSTSAKLRALGHTDDTSATHATGNFNLKLTSVFLSGGGRGRALLKPQEVYDGWQTAEMGLEFVVKLCTWQTSVFKSETDAQTHVKGQHKRTFEVLQQYRGAAAATYRLDKNPLYTLPYLALRDTAGHIADTDRQGVPPNDSGTSVVTSLAEDYLQKMEDFPLRAKKTFNPSKEEKKLWQFLVKRWLHKSEGVVPGVGEGLTEEEDNEDDDVLQLEKKLKKIRETHENEEKLRKEKEEEEAFQKELMREMYGTGVSRRNKAKLKRSSSSSGDEESDDSSGEESDDSDESGDEDSDSEETESGDEEMAVRDQRSKAAKTSSAANKRREEAKSLTSVSSSGSENDDEDEGGSSETESGSEDSDSDDSSSEEDSSGDEEEDEESSSEEASEEGPSNTENPHQVVDIETGRA